MSETKDVLALALVALVALAGLVLSNGQSEGATVLENPRVGEELGLSLGQQAYELAKKNPEQQNRACNAACNDLCPSSTGWTPGSFSRVPGSACVDFCEFRCEDLLVGDYQESYRYA